MTARQLVGYLIVHIPIALIIGIMCTIAYSLEFEAAISINWPFAFLIALAIVAVMLARDRKSHRNLGKLQERENKE